MENYTMLCMLEKTFACCTLLVSQTVLKTVSKIFTKCLKLLDGKTKNFYVGFYRLERLAVGNMEIIQDKRLFKTFWELKKL